MATIYLNATTKKMQMWMSRYLDRKNTYVYLTDCYNKPSEAKLDAYMAIRKKIKYDYLHTICILSAGPKQFSVGYRQPDPVTRKICFYVETKNNTYYTVLEGSNNMLAQRVLGIR